MESTGLAFARQVVRLGWKVIPAYVTAGGEKIPLAGGQWQNKGTLDETVLESWWERRPWAWPATVSGRGSSLVLDVDGPAGVDWFRELVNRVGWQPGGLCYRTPGKGGGIHVCWSWPSWLTTDFSQAKVVLEGGEVQLRGTGHFTVLCGARRPDLPVGERDYVLLEEPSLVRSEREPSQALVDAFLAEAKASWSGRDGSSYAGGLVSLTPDEAWALGSLVDGRKNACAGLAWSEACRGASEEEIVEVVLRFNSECCIPPLKEDLVLKKIQYAIQRVERAQEIFSGEGYELIKKMNWARGCK